MPQGAATLTLGGIAATTAATTASASTVPVVYQTFGNYQGPMIRPGHMGLGALWGFKRARWKRWNDSSAYASAKEFAAASEAGPEYRWWIRVTLSDVKRHDGHFYYTKMRLVGNPPPASRVKNVQYLVYRIPGGWFQV